MRICDTCSTIRGITPSNTQDRANCEVCGTKSLCSETTSLPSPAIAFDKGYFTTNDLSKLVALIKSRKAIIIPRIKHLQTEISKPMEEHRHGEIVYLMECLVDEGLTKKALNTCYSVFRRMKEVISKANLTVAERATKVVILQNLLAELGGLNEKEQETSVLYKNALDSILIAQLKFRMTHAQFESAFEDAKKVYHQINGNGKKRN